MGKWIVLTFTTVSCISVWVFVVISILFTVEKMDYPEQILTSEITSHAEEPTKQWDNIDDEPVKVTNVQRHHYKTRGIHLGDFVDIAPNGEISIDELLVAINQDQQ